MVSVLPIRSTAVIHGRLAQIPAHSGAGVRFGGCSDLFLSCFPRRRLVIADHFQRRQGLTIIVK